MTVEKAKSLRCPYGVDFKCVCHECMAWIPTVTQRKYTESELLYKIDFDNDVASYKFPEFYSEQKQKEIADRIRSKHSVYLNLDLTLEKDKQKGYCLRLKNEVKNDKK